MSPIVAAVYILAKGAEWLVSNFDAFIGDCIGVYERVRRAVLEDLLLEWNKRDKRLRQGVLDAIKQGPPALVENSQRSIVEIVDEVVSEKPVHQPYIWMTN